MLQNGDSLGATEFLRRYEAMPDIKKAELVAGVVYVQTPVRITLHGEPDSLIQTWLGIYAAFTPGVRGATNATACLSSEDVPQPDGLLRILPENGGRTKVDPQGYLQGAPELVVEISANGASLDLHKKFTAYRLAGACEYLVWRTEDSVVDWWMLKDDDYVPLAHENGIMKSQVFPGLWLDAAALFKSDGPGLLATLERGLASDEHTKFLESLEPKPQ
jgi:hypothetical protein